MFFEEFHRPINFIGKSENESFVNLRDSLRPPFTDLLMKRRINLFCRFWVTNNQPISWNE